MKIPSKRWSLAATILVIAAAATAVLGSQALAGAKGTPAAAKHLVVGMGRYHKNSHGEVSRTGVILTSETIRPVRKAARENSNRKPPRSKNAGG